MSRPKNKKELLLLSQKNYFRLLAYIDDISEQELLLEFPKGYLNRNIKDVLAHLHHWHLMMLGWYNEGMAGNKPTMPAEGYTWKTLPRLNREIWKKYKDMSFADSIKKLDNSFKQVQEIMYKHSNDELFTKKKYNWTGSTSLAAYLISATSSHYDWAYKLIRKCRKATALHHKG